jgi:hypothetical protein
MLPAVAVPVPLYQVVELLLVLVTGTSTTTGRLVASSWLVLGC